MSVENLDFFCLGVASEFYFFHSINQRFWNIVFVVGWSDEQDIRKVNRNINEIIDKGIVLVWIQNL